ncbi:hypothetical protein LSPH24S_02661 [Lysinibacillus sphaericus]
MDGPIFLQHLLLQVARISYSYSNESFNKSEIFLGVTASLIIGVIAFLAVKFNYGTEIDKIILLVMPLVPGILITNAVRDLMAGHFMSGMAKGAEAFLTAFAIGLAIAVILSF